MIKRKDNKGRVLNDGEIQRPDGRYCYQYMDAFGKRKSVYSWRLTPSDKTPNGKRKDLSLREKGKEINSEKSSVVSCGNITVLELFEKYISQKAGFLYLYKNGMPMVAMHWEHYFKHICQKYNKIYKVQMPKVTPHVCRHTFCSNMAKSGMNPKTLQYIMGHSNIGVTLNTYTHTNLENVGNIRFTGYFSINITSILHQI